MKGREVPPPMLELDDLKLPEVVMSEIKGQGLEKPTEIQAQGWPIALRDMVGICQTDSGRTLAYIMPAVVHI